jgi:hypothetical protein
MQYGGNTHGSNKKERKECKNTVQCSAGGAIASWWHHHEEMIVYVHGDVWYAYGEGNQESRDGAARIYGETWRKERGGEDGGIG